VLKERLGRQSETINILFSEKSISNTETNKKGRQAFKERRHKKESEEGKNDEQNGRIHKTQGTSERNGTKKLYERRSFHISRADRLEAENLRFGFKQSSLTRENFRAYRRRKRGGVKNPKTLEHYDPGVGNLSQKRSGE